MPVWGTSVRAAADLARQGPRVLRNHHTVVVISQVKRLRRLPARHDSTAIPGREMTVRRGPTTGLGAVTEAFRPAASMIFAKAETARTTSRPSSSQHLAGS